MKKSQNKHTLKQSQNQHIHITNSICVKNETDTACAKNETTFKLAKIIDDWLPNFYDIAIAIVVCVNSINVKLEEGEHNRCNLVLVLTKGGGKTTILSRLIECNPKMFVKLPEKPFESLLIQKGNEYFNRKVLVLTDMAVSFSGMRPNQLDQLLGFFTSLLSDGQYSREHNSIKAECSAIFGIALQNFKFRRNKFLTATFSDRFIFFVRESSKEEKIDTLKITFKKRFPPKIELPYFDKPKEVDFSETEQIKKEIIELSIELDSLDVMSFTRARNFIVLFMKSNALLNDRFVTSEEDLKIYKRIHPYLKNSSIIFDELELLKSQLAKGTSQEEICKTFEWSRAKFFRLKGLLKDERI